MVLYVFRETELFNQDRERPQLRHFEIASLYAYHNWPYLPQYRRLCWPQSEHSGVDVDEGNAHLASIEFTLKPNVSFTIHRILAGRHTGSIYTN